MINQSNHVRCDVDTCQGFTSTKTTLVKVSELLPRQRTPISINVPISNENFISEGKKRKKRVCQGWDSNPRTFMD